MAHVYRWYLSPFWHLYFNINSIQTTSGEVLEPYNKMTILHCLIMSSLLSCFSFYVSSYFIIPFLLPLSLFKILTLRLASLLHFMFIWISASVCRPYLSLLVIQGGSNMTGIDLYVNKPHCAAAVRPWESEVTTSTLPPLRVRTCSVLSGSCWSDEWTEGTAERGTTHCDQIPRWRKRPVRWNLPQTPTTVWGRMSP